MRWRPFDWFERRHRMAADPHILEELRRLRARVPQLTGARKRGKHENLRAACDRD